MIPLIGCLIAASQTFHAPQAQTELISSVLKVQPGVKFQIALHMKMALGWHSYYSNPGESGMATKIVWHLPPGFKAGPIRWPVPERIVIGGVVQYAYQNEVWLVTDITPPAKPWDSGRPPAIGADVSWLLCREACVPQKSKLQIAVYESEKAAPNPKFAPAAATLVPPASALEMTAWVHSGAPLTLLVNRHTPNVNGVEFFPSDVNYFGATAATVKPTSSGISLAVPLSAYASAMPSRLTGILVFPDPSNALGKAVWIDIPVKKG